MVLKTQSGNLSYNYGQDAIKEVGEVTVVVPVAPALLVSKVDLSDPRI